MTRRGAGFLGLTAAVYLIANYTRVGWVYVICAALVGVLLLSGLWALLALRGLRLARRVTDAAGRSYAPDRAAPCEGDAALVGLAVSGLWTRQLLVRLLDPLPPEAPGAFFAPTLQSGDILRRSVVWTRRGVQSFPPVQAETAAPFGLFRARRSVAAPAAVLVYPRWFAAPDHPAAARLAVAAAPRPQRGAGGAFFGVREYRPGDPVRLIHWRSSLRRNLLAVKEFEDEAQPALTVALDASADLGTPPRSSFEDAVRLAAGALRWGLDRGMLVTLVGPESPRAPAAWRQGMEYLAGVRPQADSGVARLLNGVPPNRSLLLLTPRLDAEAARAVAGWRRAGSDVTVVHLTGYIAGGDTAEVTHDAVLRCGPSSDLAVVTALMAGALSQPAPTARPPW